MGLIDLTADLTYNTNFETEPIENQQQPVSGEFQTSDLESSPTEEIGSVNFFQNPHGANEDGSGGFNISGLSTFKYIGINPALLPSVSYTCIYITPYKTPATDISSSGSTNSGLKLSAINILCFQILQLT